MDFRGRREEGAGIQTSKICGSRALSSGWNRLSASNCSIPRKSPRWSHSVNSGMGLRTGKTAQIAAQSVLEHGSGWGAGVP